jgi:hypothetical protein
MAKHDTQVIGPDDTGCRYEVTFLHGENLTAHQTTIGWHHANAKGN